MTGGTAEWIQLARSLILRTLRKGAYQRERMQWSVQESMILLPLTKVDGSPTLSRILYIWYKVRKRLGWTSSGSEIGRTLTVTQALILKNLEQQVGVREEDILRVLEEEEVWLQRHQMEDKSIMELKGWKWGGEGGEFKWFRSTREWILFLGQQKSFSDVMDEKWNQQSNLLTWKQRWGNLWDATLTYRRKIWMWKLMQRGYFTNSRAAEMGHPGGECRSCGTDSETIEHVFWECRRLQRRLGRLLNISELERRPRNILERADMALRTAPRNTASLAVFAIYCYEAWKERNEKQFRDKIVLRPGGSILKEAEEELKALQGLYTSEDRREKIILSINLVRRWKDNYSRQES
ncbi:hypothetical protein R1sor_027389 [Riccia sorocarpa]|uniref:Reverse transcriptase zinc-binding domain-containing protein n=1 Tax=Riccia sorocarpa TaxID=122646 RepID=A0ABD3GHQ7_9MARC